MAKSNISKKIAAAVVMGCVAFGSISVSVAEETREVSKEERQKRMEQFKEKRAAKKEKAQERLNEISSAANLSAEQKAKLEAYFKQKHEKKRAEIAQKCGVAVGDESQEARAKLMKCLKEMKKKGGEKR